MVSERALLVYRRALHILYITVNLQSVQVNQNTVNSRLTNDEIGALPLL